VTVAPSLPDAEPPVVDVPYELRSPATEEVRAAARRFVDDVLAPHAEEWEAAGTFPRELFAEAARAGILGWKVPPELGGSGPDLLADAVVTEELASCGSGGVAAGLGAHKDLGSYYVWRFGTDAQRRRLVPPAMAGTLVTALAVTEPGAGSDVAGITTRAERRPGGDWLLRGAKTFITNGAWADLVVVAALTDPEAGGHRGTTLLLVEAGDAGLTRRRIPTLGWRPSSTGELAFDDVLLPADRVLGGEAMLGQGFVCIMRNFQWERLVMALAAVRQCEDTLARARDAAALEGLVAEVAAARALTEHALRLHLHGADAVREVSMAKWSACELAVRVVRAVLDQAAGAGAPAAEMERLQRGLRDARLGPIGGGTTEIMLEVIGRGYGL
jgi:acyl-CoA dehydrogenase